MVRAWTVLALVLAGCGSGSQRGATALNELQPGADYYALPFPSDLRRSADGSIDLADYARQSPLIMQYVDAIAAGTRGFGSDSERPVFIVGLPRSGTTLVEQVLASHSQIHGAGELRLAREGFEALPEIMKSS